MPPERPEHPESAVIEFRIRGPQGPADVSVSDALKVLSGLEQALCALTGVRGSAIAVVDVKGGSARYLVHARHIAIAAIQAVTFAVGSGVYDDLPKDARVGLRSMIRGIQDRGWHADVTWSQEDKAPSIEIGPGTAVPDPDATMTCETTAYGYIEQVGGKAPHVVVRLDSGARVTCPANEDLARQLALRLYQPVRVSGLAEFRLEDFGLARFSSATIEPFEDAGFAAVMGELRVALADAWDPESPSQMLEDLRGRGEEA